MLRLTTQLSAARWPHRTGVKPCLLMLLALGLAACEATGARPAPDTQLLDNMQVILDDAEATNRAAELAVPSAEQLQALVPDMSLSDELMTPVADRFNVVANRENASDFFNNLVAGTDYGVAVSPEVEGEISINLPNVTIDEVMIAMQETYGYQIRRQGSIYQIQPPGLQTRIFSIDYLNVSRSGNSTVSVTSGNSGGGGGGGIGGGIAGG
ncbi:MAG: secretin N-terminal domain-containing protein, partial [Pseudohongiella sp.]